MIIVKTPYRLVPNPPNHFKTHRLFATGTTGALIEGATELALTKLMSGPLGDQQVGL